MYYDVRRKKVANYGAKLQTVTEASSPAFGWSVTVMLSTVESKQLVQVDKVLLLTVYVKLKTCGSPPGKLVTKLGVNVSSVGVVGLPAL
jgi:hypothetical protein